MLATELGDPSQATPEQSDYIRKPDASDGYHSDDSKDSSHYNKVCFLFIISYVQGHSQFEKTLSM